MQGGRIPFSGQINNYQNTVSQVVQILGDEDQAASYLSRCIYSVGLGSNDYLNNYFMPMYYGTSRQYNPQQYAQVLIQEYAQNIRVCAPNFSFYFLNFILIESLISLELRDSAVISFMCMSCCCPFLPRCCL